MMNMMKMKNKTENFNKLTEAFASSHLKCFWNLISFKLHLFEMPIRFMGKWINSNNCHKVTDHHSPLKYVKRWTFDGKKEILHWIQISSKLRTVWNTVTIAYTRMHKCWHFVEQQKIYFIIIKSAYAFIRSTNMIYHNCVYQGDVYYINQICHGHILIPKPRSFDLWIN